MTNDVRRRITVLTAAVCIGIGGLAAGSAGAAPAQAPKAPTTTTTTIKLPAKPTSCRGSYGKAIAVTQGSVVGTSGADLIYLVNSGTIAYGRGGNDCIVALAEGSLASGDEGDDVVSDLGSAARRNSLNGGAGNDRIEARFQSVANGNFGTDTCVTDPTAARISCER